MLGGEKEICNVITSHDRIFSASLKKKTKKFFFNQNQPFGSFVLI